jgi:hypothetical protein
MTPAAASSTGGPPAGDTDDDRLDAFAGRGAHVLGTGIGAVSGYATLLRRRHAERLDGDALATLDALRAGLGRIPSSPRTCSSSPA